LDRDAIKRIRYPARGGSLKAEGLGDGSSAKRPIKVQSHPFFGMLKTSEMVAQQMDRLRRKRHRSF
jgi:hypothetical protein